MPAHKDECDQRLTIRMTARCDGLDGNGSNDNEF